MPFPPTILRAARDKTHDGRPPKHNFTPVAEPAVIGYVIGTGPHGPEVASGVVVETASGLENCAVTLVQDDQRPDLYWVQVQQNDGAYLYTWQSGGKTYHYLLLSTSNPACAPDMARAGETRDRHQLALRLHAYSGLPFAVLTRMVRTVTTYEQAQLAIALAAWLLQEEGEDLKAAVDRAERLTLMRNPERLRNLNGFQPAASLKGGNALMQLTRATEIILASKQK